MSRVRVPLPAPNPLPNVIDRPSGLRRVVQPVLLRLQTTSMAIFGSKETTGAQKTSPSPAVPVSVSGAGGSHLGEGILITGKVEGSENLTLDGRVDGEIDLRADLVIGPRAQIRATVHARNISVEGRVDGDLSADQSIDLVRTATVQGTMKAPAISVAEGARFEGTVDMSMRKSSS